ncbi:MAG: transketolase, partial [Porticoccus sp.]|nr:transketolase [Porticoccus sp.]
MSTKRINNIKKNILKVSYSAKDGHVASSFSIIDILFILYDQVMNLTLDNLNNEDRDFMVLSKGHASLAHASILEEKGFITNKQLMSFCSHNSILGGHLSSKKVPGVEASTGSLGHGISISIGIALASKIKRLSNRVFVIVGDGEINEGTFWESMLLGAQHNLNNLYCIIDFNRSNDRAIKLDPLEDKLKAFGWDVLVINGHSHDEIYDSLNYQSSGKPIAIIA